MSLHLLPVSLRVMRGLVVLAIAFAAAAAYTSTEYRYHEFFAGAALGVLLVLAVCLFRAHPAEVEELPKNET
jgi:peptidoglycan/LPS O-acetylase OafA/YrhL